MIEYVYSRKFEPGDYSSDPAADRGRFDTISAVIAEHGSFIEAEPATQDDILRAHSASYFDEVARDPFLLEMALLAAGGAIQAAERGCDGIPAFAAIRPPGHHASPADAWGFCFFNNIAVAVLKLLDGGKITTAFILDFDLHFGDGTRTIFAPWKNVQYYHPEADDRQEFIEQIKEQLSMVTVDIIGVSAGFDRYINDWGKLLYTKDYETIGAIIKDWSMERCDGRRFAVLEGGYNFADLGTNMEAFCHGFG